MPQWVNGKYEGYGVEFFQNDSFHGGYRNGARHGWGAATFENGDAYEGQWANGLRHGLGMHLSADGSTYVGNFLCGSTLHFLAPWTCLCGCVDVCMCQPCGALSAAQPLQRQGSFVAACAPLMGAECCRRNGKRHGHGSFTAAAGGHYQGQYQLDVPHGHGTYLLASGHTYQGRWEAGQKEGWFQFKLPTGEQWAGEHGALLGRECRGKGFRALEVRITVLQLRPKIVSSPHATRGKSGICVHVRSCLSMIRCQCTSWAPVACMRLSEWGCVYAIAWVPRR